MCTNPQTINLKKPRIIDGVSLSNKQAVPCGKCVLCTKRKISDWLIRWTWEMERSINPLFITLTYDEKNVPRKKIERVDKSTGEIKTYTIKTLLKKDVQDFLKRLRYYDTQRNKKNYRTVEYTDKNGKTKTRRERIRPLKYIACGEYGTKGGRPHYHMILVNLENNYEILKAWPKGIVTIDPLRDGGLKYVLKYINKSNKRHREQENEFRISSAKIGDNYINKTKAWHKSNVKNSFCRINGIAAAMPKYYKDKIYTNTERARVTEHQRKMAQEKVDRQIQDIMLQYGNITKEKAIYILENRISNITLAKRNEKL